MRFWKTAIAAAIIAAGIFLGVSLFKNEDNKTIVEEVKNNNPKQEEKKITPINLKDTLKLQPQSSIANIQSQNKFHQQKRYPLYHKKRYLPKDRVVDNEITELPPYYFEPTELEYNNEIRLPNIKNPLDKRGNTKDYTNILMPPHKVEVDNSLPEIKPDDAITNNNAPENSNATEPGNTTILFMKEEKFNKTRVGGVFRKVKKAVDRTVEIKNHLKSAQYVIAIK